MSYATILHLDPTCEARVYDIWHALAEAGIDQSMLDTGVRPHITLASSAAIDQAGLIAATANFAASRQLFPVALSSIGLFATAEGVIFLGVTPSAALLEIHNEYQPVFDRFTRQPNAYYRVGVWVPHCTLAMGLSAERLPHALAIARRATLPIAGRVHELSLVRVPSGPVETLSLFQLGELA